jgi:hypothetical protein
LIKQWNHVWDNSPPPSSAKNKTKFFILIKILFTFLRCCGSRSTCFWASWLRIRIHQWDVWHLGKVNDKNGRIRIRVRIRIHLKMSWIRKTLLFWIQIHSLNWIRILNTANSRKVSTYTAHKKIGQLIVDGDIFSS